MVTFRLAAERAAYSGLLVPEANLIAPNSVDRRFGLAVASGCIDVYVSAVRVVIREIFVRVKERIGEEVRSGATDATGLEDSAGAGDTSAELPEQPARGNIASITASIDAANLFKFNTSK